LWALTIKRFQPEEAFMSQSYQDNHYEHLELFAEQTYIFFTLLAIQRRLNCDELHVLERASNVMRKVHPGHDVPLFQHSASLGM
jgi:hypothetical protein